MGSRVIAALGVMVGASVAVAACTPGEALGQPQTRQEQKAAAAAHKRYLALWHAKVPRGQKLFGSGCAQIPKTVRASPASLARLPVTTALGRIHELSMLDRAIRLAGLASKLDSTGPLTVFAPDNTAFATFGAGNLHVLLAARADLTRVVTFHVVPARVTPADLAHHHKLTTLGGTRLLPAGQGVLYGINNASVICGNLHTANATVYIVDRVIIPAR